MATTILFETHSWSEDNDRCIAIGWLCLGDCRIEAGSSRPSSATDVATTG